MTAIKETFKIMSIIIGGTIYGGLCVLAIFPVYIEDYGWKGFLIYIVHLFILILPIGISKSKSMSKGKF